MEFSSLAAALQNSRIYPEKPVKIELVQTHISAIFFAGEHLYKVKKPVNFGFLDFSALQKKDYDRLEGFGPDLPLTLNTDRPPEECLARNSQHLFMRAGRELSLAVH